jgi:hypothetical protein
LQIRAGLVGMAMAFFACGDAFAQQRSLPADSVPPSLRSFASDAELQRYLASVFALASRAAVSEDSARGAACGSYFRVLRRSPSREISASSRAAGVVVHARLQDTSGRSIPNASIEIDGTGIRAISNADGEATLRIRVEPMSPSGVTTVTSKLIGYRFVRGSFKAFPGDTVDIEATHCVQALRLQQPVSNSGARSAPEYRVDGDPPPDVEQGATARVVGRFLVILRRGRLFVIDLETGKRTGHSLRPAGVIDVPEEGLDSQSLRYEKVFAYGNRIIVWGRRYFGRGIDIASFTLGHNGNLFRDATYQIRVDCDNDCEPSFLAGRLVFHRAIPISLKSDEPYASLPAIRRWTREATEKDFHQLVTPSSVFRFSNDSSFGRHVAVHAITVCDARSAELTCQTRALIGPSSDAFYVSPSAAYIWTESSQSHSKAAPGTQSTSMLARVPLGGSTPTGLRVSGSPTDASSFREEDGKTLRVFVRLNGETSDTPDSAGHTAALLRVSLADFGDGTHAASAGDYRTLPTVEGNSFENRFVGKWLIYGIGHADYIMDESMFSSTLFAVRVDGGEPLRFRLPHMMDRMYVAGSISITIGSSSKMELIASALNLTDDLVHAKEFAVPPPARGHLELAAFAAPDDVTGKSVIGVTVRRHWHDDPPSRVLSRNSTEILFLRIADGRLTQVGAIQPRSQIFTADGADACIGSCEAWYGYARAIFVRDRIFALVGYELVEAGITHGRLVELQRLDFSPRKVLHKRQ